MIPLVLLFGREQKRIFCQKAVGRIATLEEKAMAHQCHGFRPTLYFAYPLGNSRRSNRSNAHPHCDCQKNIYLVHNGIIENYKELKEMLQKEGHKFNSETDTEVIAHLIEKFFQGNLEEAVRKALPLIKGTYGISRHCQKRPAKIVAARLSQSLTARIGRQRIFYCFRPLGRYRPHQKSYLS